MIARCEDISRKDYKHYGARGITICQEWQTFNTFYIWALESGYESGLTLDRVDVNSMYEPSNCKWATWEEQNRNRRISKYFTHDGKTKALAEWAQELGETNSNLCNRLRRTGTIFKGV